MEIRRFTNSDKKIWDAYVLAHPDGYAYHQCAWKEAVERAYGLEGIYLMAEKAGRLCGVLPLIDFNRPVLGRILVSLPYCDVGGILADDDDIAEVLQNYAIWLTNDLGATRLELRDSGRDSPLPVASGCKVRMLLDLPKSSDALLASLKAKLRSQIKKPLRDGLRATLGGQELSKEFYQVFCKNMRDLGSPVHSYSWIQSILSAYGEQARVGLVRLPDGTAAAAGIILQHGDKVSIPWASSLRKFNRMNPNMLLYWTFLAFAADHGYRQFDFGRSTSGEGTFRFKEQWGATPLPLKWQTFPKKSTPKRGVSETKNIRSLVEKTWRNIPLPICNILGPSIRRFISL